MEGLCYLPFVHNRVNTTKFYAMRNKCNDLVTNLMNH